MFKQILLAAVLIAMPVTGFTAFEMNFAATPAVAAGTTSLGDLTSLKTIITDVQAITDKGDLVGAEKRIRDFESAWDVASKTMRGLNKDDWGNVDDAADAAMSDLRDSAPDAAKVKVSVAALLATLNDPSLTP